MTVSAYKAQYFDPTSSSYLSSSTRGAVGGAVYELEAQLAAGNSMASAQASVQRRGRYMNALAAAASEPQAPSARADFLALT